MQTSHPDIRFSCNCGTCGRYALPVPVGSGCVSNNGSVKINLNMAWRIPHPYPAGVLQAAIRRVMVALGRSGFLKMPTIGAAGMLKFQCIARETCMLVGGGRITPGMSNKVRKRAARMMGTADRRVSNSRPVGADRRTLDQRSSSLARRSRSFSSSVRRW